MTVLASKQTKQNAHEIPTNIGMFSDDVHEDDLNHAEEASAQKGADLCGVFEQDIPRSEYRAIRLYCLWCCNESPSEVRQCPSTHCSLHPLRMGKRSALAPHPLRSIRWRCKDCAEDLKGIKHCEKYDCHLWGFRMGHRPKRVC